MLRRGYTDDGDRIRLRVNGAVCSMYYKKVCKKCSNTFAASHKIQDYCSNKCAERKNWNPGWRLGKKFTNERNGVGRKRLASNGYIEVYLPGHPLADIKGRVLEHRLVIYNQIKRPLVFNDVVHHINGVRSDNRPENLILLTRSGHNSHHKSEEIKHRQRDKLGRLF